MKTYKISFGNGTAWPEVHAVEVEEYQCEQDALDILIDQFERGGDEGFFLTQDEIDSGDYPADEYVVGGNHGRYLHHRGFFRIENAQPVSVNKFCAV